MPAPPALGNGKLDPTPVEPSPALPDRVGSITDTLDQIFSRIPRQAGFVVGIGSCTDMQGNATLFANKQGWGNACAAPERLDAACINTWLDQHGVPRSLDCLLLNTGSDLQAWNSLDARYVPSLVVATFDPRITPAPGATALANSADADSHAASLQALCALAAGKGYRPIRISAPCNVYLLRNDIGLPPELTIDPNLTKAELDALLSAHLKADETGPTSPGTASTGAPPALRDNTEPSPKTTRVDIDGLIVEVLANKNDGNWYLQRKTFEEKASLLYSFIRDEGFATFVDVGANYGFVSMLARRASPALKIIAIEADPRLARLIKTNFLTNKLAPPTIIHAIAGDHGEAQSRFSLNPKSTLDNRVDIAQWEHVDVPMVTVDEVLELTSPVGRTFFKIDTQGFELRVLHGMEACLRNHTDWVLKMEFAPNWLSSQGTDPMDVLDYLQQRYQFAEFQERIPFGTPSMEALFAAPVLANRHGEFLDYVTSLNKNKLGWVDLIVRPKPLPSRH